jgi:hypothetical protein
LGALAWSFFRWRPLSEKENPAPISQQNPQEKKLLDTLNLFTTTTLLVSDSLVSSPLYLTDTLLIQKDSLYILGNENFVIKADPGFKGPGILLAPGCQYILLEDIVFENFDVAILAQNKSLHLKNVQFKNCRVPVQYQFAFPDNNYVSGDFSDSAFFKSDSLPHQVK